MDPNSRTYSSAEACNLAGISYRQLDYWCRLAVVEPHTAAHGSGTRRRWTGQQVATLAVLALVGGHVRISGLSELAATLLDWDLATWADTTLLVDSTGVWLAGEAGAPPVGTYVDLGAVLDQVLTRAGDGWRSIAATPPRPPQGEDDPWTPCR